MCVCVWGGSAGSSGWCGPPEVWAQPCLEAAGPPSWWGRGRSGGVFRAAPPDTPAARRGHRAGPPQRRACILATEVTFLRRPISDALTSWLPGPR